MDWAAPDQAEQSQPAEDAANPLPERVLAGALSLNVPHGALHAAWEAYLSALRGEGKNPQRGESSEIAATKLRMWEGDGMRAVAALIRGDACGSFGLELVRVAWAPGREDLLISIADDKGASREARGTALDCLAVADTARTRDYLIERLGRERDSTLSLSIVNSLGTLHEPRGAEIVVSLMREKEWGRDQRVELAHALVGMDPYTARQELLGYLHAEECDIPFGVVIAINTMDQELARKEAVWVLQDVNKAAKCDEKEWLALQALTGPVTDQEKK